MKSDADLERWILAALRSTGGTATIVEIARYIWSNHEAELRSTDELFYTWQYRMRWAGERLKKAGKLRKTKQGSHGRWILLPH
jgi:hypothetical protein